MGNPYFLFEMITVRMTAMFITIFQSLILVLNCQFPGLAVFDYLAMLLEVDVPPWPVGSGFSNGIDVF